MRRGAAASNASSGSNSGEEMKQTEISTPSSGPDALVNREVSFRVNDDIIVPPPRLPGQPVYDWSNAATSVVEDKDAPRGFPVLKGPKSNNYMSTLSTKEQLARYFHMPYLPCIQWAKKYSRVDAMADLMAGLTLSVMIIPSAMAEAMLAQLPPISGLYTAVLSPFAYSMLGTSGQLSMGTMAMVSIFMPDLAAELHMKEDDIQGHVKASINCSFLVGTILMGMGILRMGRLLNYISHTVVAGFTTASGIYIGVTQLGNLFGFKLPQFDYNYQAMWHILKSLPQSRPWSSIIGFISLAYLVSMRYARIYYHPTPQRLQSKLFRAFRFISSFSIVIVVVVATVITKHLVMTGHHVRVVGKVDGGLEQSFGIPPLDASLMADMITPSMLIAMLAYLESYAVAHKFATKIGYELDPSQELVALGVSSIATSFCSGYPPGGSLSRTAMAAEAGARTPFYNLVVGGAVIVVLSCAMDQLIYVPKAVLAAVIEVAILNLIDWPEFVHAWSVDKADFLVMVVTAFTTLFISVDLGLGVGFLFSFVMLINNLNTIQTSMMGALESNMVDEVTGVPKRIFRALSQCPDAVEVESVKVVKPITHLFFANANGFKETMIHIMDHEPGLAFLVIDASGISNVDLPGLKALDDIRVAAEKRGISLLMANVRGVFRKKAEAAGLLDQVGTEAASASVDDVVHRHIPMVPDTMMVARASSIKKSKSFWFGHGLVSEEGDDYDNIKIGDL